MSTHDEPGGSHYTPSGEDPVDLFGESGYGSEPSAGSGRGADLGGVGSPSSFGERSEYGDQETSVLASLGSPSSRLDEPYEPVQRSGSLWHGGADFGLLVLRIVLGGTFVVYGLQHLFRLFDGSGLDSFAKFLQAAGYHYPTVMAWVGGGTELVGGALLVLGLFTPAAAGALLAVISNVIVLKWPLGYFAANGWQFQLVLAAAAFALLFAGPGRVSLDRPTPWHRHPVMNGFIFLIIGAAASVCVLLLLRTHGPL